MNSGCTCTHMGTDTDCENDDMMSAKDVSLLSLPPALSLDKDLERGMMKLREELLHPNYLDNRF